MAMLPIQRVLLSGANVLCWKTVKSPFSSALNSYQRIPYEPSLFCTVCVTTMLWCAAWLAVAGTVGGTKLR